MTHGEFKKAMEIWGDEFYEKTCDKLSFEIVKRIVNCKALDEFGRMTLLRQYMGNLTTNDCVIESIKQLNK